MAKPTVVPRVSGPARPVAQAAAVAAVSTSVAVAPPCTMPAPFMSWGRCGRRTTTRSSSTSSATVPISSP
jgi:hypothetical protein